MSETLIFNNTWGRDEPERATLPFIAANIAAASGQKAAVLCTIEAVHLGTTGGTDGVQREGFPALAEVYGEFIGNGGEVWLCSACTKPRGITEADVAKGARIVGAAYVVEQIVGGAKTVAFS